MTQSPSLAVPAPALRGLLPFLLLAGHLLAAASPDPTRITSVAAGPRTVFALTRSGFHQGSTGEGTWAAAPVPDSMARGGAVVGDPDGDLYHWTVPESVFETFSPGFPAVPGPRTPADGAAGFAIHRRHGVDGRWERVSEAPVDQLLVSGTNLFAIARPLPGGGKVGRVLRSGDGGRSWADLTPKGGFEGMMMLMALFPDPDHPGQACVLGAGLRGYVFQSPDGSDRWDMERELAWHRKRSGWDPFADTNEMPGVPLVTATLGTYFGRGFGDSPRRPLLGLEVGGARRFPAGGKAVVIARVRHRGEAGKDEALSVVDRMDGTALWGLRRVTPSGKAEAFEPSADTPGTKPRESRDFMAEPLPSGGEWKRTLDLSALAPFTEKGRYRVQLVYAGDRAADAKRKEWVVRLASPVVELEVE